MDDAGEAFRTKQYVLVLDDDTDDRFFTCMLLQRFGCAVFTAHSAAEAVEFMTVAPPAAVVAGDGPNCSEIGRLIRQDARFLDVPLILLASGAGGDADACIRMQESDVLLLKPIDVEMFYKAVQELIQKGPRRNLRVSVNLPVAVEDAVGKHTGNVTVLSEYGLFFRTLAPMPVGTIVPVRLTLEGGEIRVAAEVLYVTEFYAGPFREPGMGMKFTTIKREDRERIRSFILGRFTNGLGRRR